MEIGNNIIHQTSLKGTKKLLLETLNQLVYTRNRFHHSFQNACKNDQLFSTFGGEIFCEFI